MKHFIPLAAAAAFALWTYALLYYQKRLIHKKLNSSEVKIKIENKMDDLIGRIVPDLALPFLPPSLISKLKSKGSEELIRLIPRVDNEIDKQWQKYLLKIVLAAALVGLILGYIGAFAACPESNG